MRSIQLIAGIATVVLATSCVAQQKPAKTSPQMSRGGMSPPRLVSVHVTQKPALNGKGDDQVWRAAIPLRVISRRPLPPQKGTSVPVTIRSVHTDTDIYFLVTWQDTTESVSHKTWIWNKTNKAYEQSAEREDMFSLAFAHTGPFNPDMLSGIESVWDVWHWKAFRTNPQGYATDKTHRYTSEKPEGKAKSHKARADKTIWIARPEDAGTSVEKKQPAPADFNGEQITQYLPGAPSGSAADVHAKGVWADGRWTLELSRRLDTKHPDDTAFDRARTYRIALGVFDSTGSMDKASGVIELSFVSGVVTLGFENDNAGIVPASFSTALTGKGGPGRWIIREEANAPSGSKVVAQTTDDRTSYRFPLLVHDKLVARDVDISIRFKPISGSVDQAAGIVWRYLDRNNYYIVRANALEDNVVLYKVEKGRRSDLDVKGTKSSYGAEAKVPSGRWNSLRVVAVGKLFQVYLNDQQLFEVEDTTFTEPGKVGLWTKADSVTYFDDLTIVRPNRSKR